MDSLIDIIDYLTQQYDQEKKGDGEEEEEGSAIKYHRKMSFKQPESPATELLDGDVL